MQPDQPTPARCPARYERVGGRLHGDRIVHCHLEAGHPGEHEEADTEVTWLPDEPDDLDRLIVEQLQDPEFVRAWLATQARNEQQIRDAAHQRGLAAGQAERDQLRRLHEATEAALEQAKRLLDDARDQGRKLGYGRGFEQGIAEGRRQATEGLAREWGVELSDEDEGRVWPADDEADAREYVVRVPSHRVVSRLVGPWETADEPCCDLHGRNCEQGGEECCEHCTEAHHFEIGHGGVPCSSPDLSAAQPEDGGR